MMEFHVFDERVGSDTEHEFIIFIMEVSCQFIWNCFLHVLRAGLHEVVFAGEEFKLLITQCLLLPVELSIRPGVLDGEHAWVGC